LFVISGDADWYGKQQVRSLDGSFIEAATRCGVQVVSGDYTNPDEMKFFVW
jgi:thiamine monophosphate kinase